jgi:hypothetical protein
MSRPLTIVTYLLALVMMITLSHNLWLALIFPAWVPAGQHLHPLRRPAPSG